ncbi:MAG: ABC transporter ATP-binding protein [Oscillospiraceae bacterium]
MIKKLSVYLKGYGKAAAVAPVLVVLEVVCELALPLLMARIIDVGINGTGGMPYILTVGAIMVALGLFSMLCGTLSAKFASTASQGFGANLRAAMFNKIQEFSFADIDRFSSASLITRMTNDVNTIQMMLGMGLRIVTRAPVMLIAALCVCLTINAKLSLVLVGMILVLGLFIGLMIKFTYKLFEAFQKKIDAVNGTVQENLVAIRVVKAFVRENHERKKFKTSNDELTGAGLHAMGRMIVMQPVMMITLNVATLLVLWFGGQMVMGSTMQVGDLSSFITYISQILMSVMMVAMSLLQLTRASACVKRILEVLETEPDIEDATDSAVTLPAPAGKVEFRDASFKYLATGTGDDVLAHISLDIAPGQFVAIVGGTGVGKSSLVNLIPRFYDATGGSVLVDGLDVKSYPLDDLRGRIGMVLQNNVLFSGTIRENLLWGNPDATEEQLIEAAKDAQAYDFIKDLPDGFDTRLDQGGVNVSGGQKQRLCIARAMLKKPSILILDDSTSAVDTATEGKIRQSFHKNLKGTTVIIIAQRISSVQFADKIVVLEDDHLAAQGTHQELLQTSDIYKEIYQSQQEGVTDNG